VRRVGTRWGSGVNEARRLRLLIVSDLFPKESNHAAGVFIARQAEFLARQGVGSSFVVPRMATAWPLTRISRWKKYDFNRDPLKGPAEFAVRPAAFFSLPGAWSLPFTSRRWAEAAARVGSQWHREEPFDVVMGVDMTANAWAAARIGKSCGIPVASIAIGSDIMVRINDSSVLMNQLLHFLPDIDLPMGVSRMICRRMEDLGRCSRSPMLIHLPRDTQQFHPVENKAALRRKLDLDERRVVALFCGNLIAVKGIAELVEACAGCTKPTSRYSWSVSAMEPSRRTSRTWLRISVIGASSFRDE
jgi:hypothetical protein